MNESEDIGQQKRTFVLELLRSIPQGFIETAGTTFAMYVAIRLLGSPVWMKVAIAAASSVGLLLSLFTVQIVRRLGCSVNMMSVFVWSIAAVGFSVSALAGDSQSQYVIGVCLAAVMLTAGAPLISQIYRKHYSNKVRGRLFSIGGVVRASTSAIAGVTVGSWLAHQGEAYHGLFWLYALACIMMSLCVLMMAKVTLRRTQSLRLFDAFQHVSRDKAFRKLLFTWMILGLGNLLCFALFVEFITNPEYGFALDAKKAGWVTTTIPMMIYVICVVPWGMIFDKLPFYRLRVLVNLFFVLGILTYYLGGSYTALCVGMVFYGIAKAGGSVLWSLWVTKFSNEDNVGEYMSVHTSFTGIRGTLAPILSFTVVGVIGPSMLAIIGCSMILLASLLLTPELIAEARENR